MSAQYFRCGDRLSRLSLDSSRFQCTLLLFHHAFGRPTGSTGFTRGKGGGWTSGAALEEPSISPTPWATPVYAALDSPA